MQHELSLDFYSLADIIRIVDTSKRLSLSDEVRSKIDAGATFVQKKAEEDRYIYGVNTGFGSLCETRVADDEIELLQYNHVISHAVGVGPIVSKRLSKLVLFIKLLTFRTGHTGVSTTTVDRLIDFWNHDAIPTIPKKGTVGASGDLAPLAHLALPVIGLGEFHFRDEIVPAEKVNAELGWQPLKLKPKEGLALTNGVQYLNAMAAESLDKIGKLIKAADVLAAISSQAFSASRTFYQPEYHLTSWHEERREVAANLRRLLEGSNHYALETCNKSMQDPYSYRCTPQVHGAIRQVYRFAKEVIEKECNSVSDNPLFFPEKDLILFGGNLHGESSAIQMDVLAIAVSELSNISERRAYQLLSGQRGLPDFLVSHFGVNSGMMIVQYTSAALLNENKVLCHPASVDTIPTCQLQEDHVSMGGTSGYKLQQIIENTSIIMAIELLIACQAVDLNEPLTLSAVTKNIHEDFRRYVDFLDVDRVLAGDIETARKYFENHLNAWATELSLA